jgi:hypothetical protein
VKIYDRSSFTVVPAAAGMRNERRGLVPQGVQVIYVSGGEPQQREQRRGGRKLSRAAERLHRMADFVDDMRRSIERANAYAAR